MALGTLFSDPFNTGLAAGGAEAGGYPIAINGKGYQLDILAGPQRQAISVTRDKPQNNAIDSTSEQTLLPGDVWRRVRDSWHQGDAQVSGDRETSLPYRFASSKGVDVWDKWHLSLLPDVTQKVAVTDANPWVGVVDGQLAVVEGTNLRWYADAGASAVTRTLSSAAVSVTQAGGAIYIALAGGTIVSCAAGGTPTTFATLASVSFIGWFKDFLVAAAGNVLYNVTTGTPVTIRTHPLSAFRWVAGAEGLSCIYLLGGAGDSWVIHRLTIDESGTVLNPPIVSSMLPDGEYGKSLGSYMGYLFVGTTKGVRFGVPQSTGDVTLGPLIETAQPVRCFEGQGRFVWFGLSNYTTNATGLGRMDLTTFTEPLAPASASDLTVDGSTADVTAVATWLGKTVFAVASLGVYIESANLVPTGYLFESDITFGVPDPKNGHYAIVRTDALDGTVTLDFSYDGSSYRNVAAVTTPGSTSSGNSFLNGQQFGSLTAKLTLARSTLDTTKGPVVTRWEVRAEPVTGRGSQWNIPVIISSEYQIGDAALSRNPDDDREELIALVGSGAIVTYREGRLSWQVNLVDYVWKPTHTDQQGAYLGTLTLLAREVK